MGVNTYLANFTKKELSGYLGKSDEYDFPKTIAKVLKSRGWKKTDQLAIIDDDGNLFWLDKFHKLYDEEEPLGEDESGLGPQSRAELRYSMEDDDHDNDLVNEAFATFQLTDGMDPATRFNFGIEDEEEIPSSPTRTSPRASPKTSPKTSPKASVPKASSPRASVKVTASRMLLPPPLPRMTARMTVVPLRVKSIPTPSSSSASSTSTSSARSTNVGSLQCACKTQKGTRCLRKPAIGSRYCKQHENCSQQY